MTTEPTSNSDAALEPGWRGDFRTAEEHLLDASLAATPSARLKWLEEALAFAAKMGELRESTENGATADGNAAAERRG